jgi:hypothetical protein
MCLKESFSVWARGKQRNREPGIPCHLYLSIPTRDTSGLTRSCSRNPGGCVAEGGCNTTVSNYAGIPNAVLLAFSTAGGEDDALTLLFFCEEALVEP